ncbi:hypothetical protein MTR67_034758, partial [Solanum verrucosum]
VGFYWRFIKDFSKVGFPFCRLLEKQSVFNFDEAFLEAFSCLKEILLLVRIIVAPDWSIPFELMCDSCRVTFGNILGQRKGNIFHPVYYASMFLNVAKKNYTITRQELSVVVYTFEKFRAYLLGTKVVVHTYHAAI